MNIKYILKLLIIYLLVNNLCISSNNYDLENFVIPIFIKKCFLCFSEEIQDEEILLSEFLKVSLFERIPKEILWKISIYLTPREIKNVSYTCKKFQTNIEENFWNAYLNNYKQKKWDESMLADKVAFAYLFYEEGKIYKASLMKMPQAIKLINNKIVKQKSQNLSYYFFNHKNKLLYERF